MLYMYTVYVIRSLNSFTNANSHTATAIVSSLLLYNCRLKMSDDEMYDFNVTGKIMVLLVYTAIQNIVYLLVIVNVIN
jgi:hypothetical protein